MRGRGLAVLVLVLPVLAAPASSGPPPQAPEDVGAALSARARRFLIDLVRIDTSNPPGNETAAAEYLKRIAGEYEIPAELLGAEPSRLNFVARLRGAGEARPLLLMAHSDVVPADRSQWSVDPFAGELRGDEIYGRGAQDDKNLLAAELAVLVELKLRGIRLKRDVILLAEADEESGSTGIQWLVANAWDRIDAASALNEGGQAQDLRSGVRLFQVQTAEKIPSRVILRAHGTAGHASLPRPDNAIVRLAEAILRLQGDQPVRLNATTRRYFTELARLPDYAWLAPLVSRLDHPALALQAAGKIRARDPELDAQLRTTVSPTMLQAGIKINVIPNTAEAQLDVRRLPNETREELLARFRRMVNDPAVEVLPAGAEEMPAAEPSSITSADYRAMERVLVASSPLAVVVPVMSRGATDGAYLRQKGMAVYGAPLFLKEKGESRAHGNDERIAAANLEAATGLLWRIVLALAQSEPPSEPAPR